jgi:hypothetical protein
MINSQKIAEQAIKEEKLLLSIGCFNCGKRLLEGSFPNFEIRDCARIVRLGNCSIPFCRQCRDSSDT